jgi:hypothetical protein
MFGFIHIPKAISKTEFELNKDNYMDFSKKKFEDKYLIYENSLLENEEESIWLINDICRSVKKTYGECIFLIIGLDNESNIEIVLSNTIDITNMDYHSKFSSSQNDLDKLIPTLNQKIKLLKHLFSLKTDVLVFNKNVDADILDLLIKFNFLVKSEREFSDLLYKTSNVEKGIGSYLPYLIVFSVSIVLYIMISYFINDYNTKINNEFLSKEQALRSELNIFLNKNSLLEKEILEYKEKLTDSDSKGTRVYKKDDM